MIFPFEKLEIWQISMDLVDQAYEIAKKYPDNQKFGLTSQLTRAAVSISLNIAEGSVRGKKEFAQFLNIAKS